MNAIQKPRSEKGVRTKRVVKQVSPAFEDFLFDWDYETYLCIGGYGSGKSYHIAFKIILKCLEEKRKVLVVRQVFNTLEQSCFDLFAEILEDMGLLTTLSSKYRYAVNRGNKVSMKRSPMQFTFPNGSKILFRGLDNPERVKSINGVSIVWIEEASELSGVHAYHELLGRLRSPTLSMHFFLSTNPISRENWIYKRFFAYSNEKGQTVTILDENRFYEKKTIVRDGVYYHHSIPTDNPWLPFQYLKRLDQLKNYDYPLYLVARWGQFGATGMRVLPQIRLPKKPDRFVSEVNRLGPENMYFGFDFGFEESYNAVISCSVDLEKGNLYIWDEIYVNHITDDLMAQREDMQELKKRIEYYNMQGYNKVIVADNEDPKAIQYYRQCGFRIRACRNKFAGSRLSNTRKIKRFKRIFISPRCKNTIRELKDLTYAKKKDGTVVYDDFNIDPHTFSALWYALDTVTVADLKVKEFNSKRGSR